MYCNKVFHFIFLILLLIESRKSYAVYYAGKSKVLCMYSGVQSARNKEVYAEFVQFYCLKLEIMLFGPKIIKKNRPENLGQETHPCSIDKTLANLLKMTLNSLHSINFM